MNSSDKAISAGVRMARTIFRMNQGKYCRAPHNHDLYKCIPEPAPGSAITAVSERMLAVWLAAAYEAGFQTAKRAVNEHPSEVLNTGDGSWRP